MKPAFSKLLRWSFLLFVFSIPFCARKFLFAFPMPFGNEYTAEYASAFIYGSDVLFLIFLFFLFARVRFAEILGWIRSLGKIWLFLALFLCFGALSIFLADHHVFAAYSLVRLLLVSLVALSVGFVIKNNFVRFREVTWAIALSAVCESVIGVLQFMWQKSVGLLLLGEIAFWPGVKEVGMVAVNGEKFIRAYGTMPHSNILAGFLVLGLLSLFYLFLTEEKTRLRVFECSGIFMVLTGIFLTFSRSGWIVCAAGALLTFFFAALDREKRKHALQLGFVVLLSLVLLLMIVGWAVFPRAHLSANEGPVKDRWDYNKIGLTLLISRPFGVGIGNELFYASRGGLFDLHGLSRLEQWQPIHNLYLLVGSEVGILGLISFLFLLALLLFSEGRRFESRFSKTLLVVLLLSGLFDHFLWDLQLGRLMFWVVLGILISTSAGPHSTTDSV